MNKIKIYEILLVLLAHSISFRATENPPANVKARMIKFLSVKITSIQLLLRLYYHNNVLSLYSQDVSITTL